MMPGSQAISLSQREGEPEGRDGSSEEEQGGENMTDQREGERKAKDKKKKKDSTVRSRERRCVRKI